MSQEQSELLAAYEEASRAWVARMQAETALWPELTAKLATARTPAEFFDLYSKCMAQRMQMALEDSRQAVEQYQQMAQRLSKAAISVPLPGQVKPS